MVNSIGFNNFMVNIDFKQWYMYTHVISAIRWTIFQEFYLFSEATKSFSYSVRLRPVLCRSWSVKAVVARAPFWLVRRSVWIAAVTKWLALIAFSIYYVNVESWKTEIKCRNLKFNNANYFYLQSNLCLFLSNSVPPRYAFPPPWLLQAGFNLKSDCFSVQITIVITA